MLEKFIDTISNDKKCIFVIGDCMLDEYFNVKVTRINPESPSNCVSLTSSFLPAEILPGGASNICYQLKKFNVDLLLLSLFDKKALKIFKKNNIFGNSNVKISSLQLEKECFIPRKRRFFDKDIQVGNRLDIEKDLYGLSKEKLKIEQNNLCTRLYYAIEDYCPKVIILSDYNKGLFYDNFNFIKKSNEYKIIVDPKDHPVTKWKDKCDIFKPNAIEAYKLSEGIKDWKKQCDYFQEKINCDGVVITLEGDGVVGKYKKEYFSFETNNAIIPAKISGAGDFFVGILGLCISHDYSLQESARIAFECCSVYVKNKSRDPLDPYDILLNSFYKSKILNQNNLLNICNRFKNKKIGFTNGCFDFGLTKNHVQYLQKAKEECDVLIVALNSDESIKRIKGKNRPIMNLEERMYVVSGLSCVDFVTFFEEDTPLECIKYIKPNIIIKGGDYKKEEVIGGNLVEKVVITKKFNSMTTTDKENIFNSL